MCLPNTITLVLGFQNSNENLSNTLRPRRSVKWLIMINWLIFTFLAMQAHQWVLDNMDKWVEKYLIADNSIRIRNGRYLRALSIWQNWPAGPLPDQSVSEWNRLFPRVFAEKPLLPVHYLGFDWSGWIVLIKSEIVITTGMIRLVSCDK